MTNPSPPPGVGDLMESALVGATSALGPLGPLLAKAFGLFGSNDSGASPRERVVDGHPVVDPNAFTGSSADAEAAAGKQLSAQTDTLSNLDKHLDDLSQKITDQNAAAKQKLLDMKAEIDKELDYIKTSADDNVVKSGAVSQFLQDKAGDIAKVVTDAAGTVNANQSQLEHIGQQYGQQGGQGGVGDQGGSYGPPGPAYGPGASYGEGYGDAYGDDGSGAGLGEMLPGLASSIPGALGGMNPLSSMGGLGDLSSVLGDAVRRGRSDHRDDDDRDRPDGKPHDPEPQQKPGPSGQAGDPGQQGGQQQPGTQAPPAASAAATPPPQPPAPSLVKRPDGTTAPAVSPAVASAATAHLEGASLEDAYKAAGITLPPAGTAIKDTLPSLSVAQPGDLAVFKDKYVMLLGDGKIYLDGQEQPVSALAKMTGFMAFCHPPASSTPNLPAPTTLATGGPAAVAPSTSA